MQPTYLCLSLILFTHTHTQKKSFAIEIWPRSAPGLFSLDLQILDKHKQTQY